jgi:hypothetical protein
VTRSAARTAGLLLLVGLVAGCDLVGPDELDNATRDLRVARATWAGAGIVDYDLTVEERCYCGLVGPVVVLVRNGERAGVVVPDSYQGPPLTASAFPHVEELFAIIDDAIERRAHRLRVVYHPTLGYPSEISIDYRENVIDEERSWEVDLRPVESVR